MDFQENILRNFTRIASHPRPSGHEDVVAADLAAWGREQGFTARVDNAKNVVIEVPASPGCEMAPVTILQGHTDMVCVAADGVAFDPLTDVPKLVRDGDALHASGTTLGADDGLGLAISMTLAADPALRHGPLRILATADEEKGMSGAGALDNAALDGKYLINLDSEEMGVLTNSSAGSQSYTLTLRAARIPAPYRWAFRITFSGFRGGHSGVDIHKNRANAICLLGRLLASAPDFALASLSGGTAYNAIPTGISAVVVTDSPEALCHAVNTCRAYVRARYTEPDSARITLESCPRPADTLPCAASRDAASLIASLPCGVRTMSQDFDGLVESSCSVGVVSLDGDTVTIGAFARSSVASRLLENEADYRRLAAAHGFTVSASAPGTGWPVDPANPLEAMFTEAYRAVTGAEMTVSPIHAGLECGSFAARNPKLSIVSVGPTITGAHSPLETADLSVLNDFTRVVAAVIEKIAAQV
ncbi:MAG: beta-Ala-His dipeptidase [Clostridiaceae bacterium]|nr:beta-Ala-His dipeptidase [Clostridiaceae bacterium]